MIKNNYYKFVSGHYYCRSNFIGWYMGFLGVFFAIPLATLVKAVLSAWPSNNEFPEQQKCESISIPLGYGALF